MPSEATRPPPARDLLLGCAVLLLAVAVLLPPEIHPWSRLACHILAAASLAILALAGRPGRSRIPSWLLLLLPFAAASILGASCRSRAIDEGMEALLLILSGHVGRSLAEDERARRIIPGVMSALAAAVALQAILQHHVAYPWQAGLLRAANPTDPTGLLIRLEAGRPSGPFTLPAALGGFLALTIPSTLARLLSPAHPGRRAALAAILTLEVYALFLTRSIGALGALAAGVVVGLPILAPRRRKAVLASVLLLFAAGTVCFVQARRGEFRQGPEANPLVLRAGNWGAAARMIRDHPLFGTGPGSFGTYYPRYMRPGMNETRFAHNSYLQVAAGWGLWVIVPLGALVMAVGRAAGAARRETFPVAQIRLPILAGGAAFLLHNLVDFTAYLPGVAVPAGLMIGLGLGPTAGEGGRDAAVSRRSAALRIAAAALVALLSIERLAGARSQANLHDALAAGDRGEIDRALGLARRAVSAHPSDPDPHALLAQMVLAHRLDDTRLRKEGEEAAATAVRLDPQAAILHYTRSLYHQSAGEPASAYRERFAAHLLYPLKALYRTGNLEPEEVERR